MFFFKGVPKIEDGLQSFVSVVSGLPDIAADVDHSVERYLQQPSSITDVSSHSVILYVLSVQCTDQVPLNIGRIIARRNGCLVSTTELLKCHAFTECLLLVMLPKGIRIEGFFTPKRHFESPFVFLSDPPRKSLHMVARALSRLGDNPTQHLGHSGASSNGKPASTGDESKADVTLSSQKGLRDSVATPAPAESKALKDGGAKSPQPVAVDGRGDTSAPGEVGPTSWSC